MHLCISTHFHHRKRSPKGIIIIINIYFGHKKILHINTDFSAKDTET